MLYTIVFFIIAIASFVFAMLGLGGGMVYVPVLNWAGFDRGCHHPYKTTCRCHDESIDTHIRRRIDHDENISGDDS